MGCDYYIVKSLYIYYDNDKCWICSLSTERGYYYFNYDEDADDYEYKRIKYIDTCLTPQMKPIVIYENDSFNKEIFETKYKTLIENEMNKCDIKWSDVNKIMKMEDRYERE
jgi:hypothetical protein